MGFSWQRQVRPQQPVDGFGFDRTQRPQNLDDQPGTDGAELLGLDVRRLPQARLGGLDLDVTGPAEPSPGDSENRDEAV